MITTRAIWRKSSYSGGNGGNCVEVQTGDRAAIRDSKDPHGPRLDLKPRALAAFTAAIKEGRL